ncbi:MAG: metallophosphoesterase [Candidatus Omnitrophica bacterium]|nr:metallophosphoesterase [Candidatus Omnitrophota bacterium]
MARIYNTRLLFIILLCIAVIVFTTISILQWVKLANEEYLYNNPKTLKRKLATLPSDFNIENIQRLKTSVDPLSFKFVVLGDSEGHHDVFGRILEGALSHNPDFIIHLGDLTEQGKLRHYVRELRFIKENVNVPFIAIIGNHDYYNKGNLSYAHLFGPLDFYFDIGSYRFIFIDNNFKDKVKPIVPLPGSDFGWKAVDGVYDETLEQLEGLMGGKSRNNLIFMHQPPAIGEWVERAFTKNRIEFMDLVTREDMNVRYVCAGHMHGYDMKEVEGVKFIVSGGAGGTHKENADAGVFAKYHYILFEADDAGISDTVYYLD